MPPNFVNASAAVFSMPTKPGMLHPRAPIFSIPNLSNGSKNFVRVWNTAPIPIMEDIIRSGLISAILANAGTNAFIAKEIARIPIDADNIVVAVGSFLVNMASSANDAPTPIKPCAIVGSGITPNFSTAN